MNKKFLAISISFLFLLTVLLTIDINDQKVNNTVSAIDYEMVYVDGTNTEGPWDGTMNYPYRHIQDAVENSTDFDTISVCSGTYYESVTIDKSLTLLSENKNNVIIDGCYENVIISVTKDHVTIKNFTIRNSGGYMNNAGIKLESQGNIVTDCVIYRTKTGIYVNETENNDINNCTFHTNGEGIFLKSSSDIKIKDCYFTHNAIGLHLQDASKIEISNSCAYTNGIGFFCTDSSNVDILDCASYNNNDNQKGIFFDRCSSINVINSNIYHNGVGIDMEQCFSILIDQCDICWNTHNAVRISENSRDITISNSEILNNFRYAVYVDDNSYADIHDNNIYKNTLYGVFCNHRYCDAKNNWWGSSRGPSFTGLGRGDRITLKRSVHYFPWSLKSLENIGSDWEHENTCPNLEISTTRYVHIDIEGLDTDDDGVPDWWEKKYDYNPQSWDDHERLDQDNDGLNNVEECFTEQWDSDPFHKDIFLEFDWMESRHSVGSSNKPSSSLIEELKTIFKEHGINLHIDTGNLGGGEKLPYLSHFSYADLRDFYWNYFLHNDLNNPRKGIFHYALVCDYGPGPGFAFVGWDHLDSFDISAQMLQDNQPRYNRELLIIGGSVHELGHTLGLFVDDHGGNDNRGATKIFSWQWWKYRNYKSCMNYLHTYRTLSYSDGSHGRGDFDDWKTLDFYFFKDTHFEWPK